MVCDCVLHACPQYMLSCMFRVLGSPLMPSLSSGFSVHKVSIFTEYSHSGSEIETPINKPLRVEAETHKVFTNVYRPKVNLTRAFGLQASHAFISTCA